MSGDANGGPVHSRANAAVTAEQAVRAFELRLTGQSYRAIAAALGVSPSTAHTRVTAYIAELAEPLATEVRALELERLDYLWRKGIEVLERQHVTVSHGKVIRREVGVERDESGTVVLDGEGKPIPIYEDLLDDGPTLQAIDRLLRIQERRAKLLGLDAPTPLRADVIVHPVDPEDLELMQLIRKQQQQNAEEEARIRGTSESDEAGTEGGQ